MIARVPCSIASILLLLLIVKVLAEPATSTLAASEHPEEEIGSLDDSVFLFRKGKALKNDASMPIVDSPRTDLVENKAKLTFEFDSNGELVEAFEFDSNEKIAKPFYTHSNEEVVEFYKENDKPNKFEFGFNTKDAESSIFESPVDQPLAPTPSPVGCGVGGGGTIHCIWILPPQEVKIDPPSKAPVSSKPAFFVSSTSSQLMQAEVEAQKRAVREKAVRSKAAALEESKAAQMQAEVKAQKRAVREKAVHSKAAALEESKAAQVQAGVEAQKRAVREKAVHSKVAALEESKAAQVQAGVEAQKRAVREKAVHSKAAALEESKAAQVQAEVEAQKRAVREKAVHSKAAALEESKAAQVQAEIEAQRAVREKAVHSKVAALEESKAAQVQAEVEAQKRAVREKTVHSKAAALEESKATQVQAEVKAQKRAVRALRTQSTETQVASFSGRTEEGFAPITVASFQLHAPAQRKVGNADVAPDAAAEKASVAPPSAASLLPLVTLHRQPRDNASSSSSSSAAAEAALSPSLPVPRASFDLATESFLQTRTTVVSSTATLASASSSCQSSHRTQPTETSTSPWWWLSSSPPSGKSLWYSLLVAAVFVAAVAVVFVLGLQMVIFSCVLLKRYSSPPSSSLSTGAHAAGSNPDGRQKRVAVAAETSLLPPPPFSSSSPRRQTVPRTPSPSCRGLVAALTAENTAVKEFVATQQSELNQLRRTVSSLQAEAATTPGGSLSSPYPLRARVRAAPDSCSNCNTRHRESSSSSDGGRRGGAEGLLLTSRCMPPLGNKAPPSSSPSSSSVCFNLLSSGDRSENRAHVAAVPELVTELVEQLRQEKESGAERVRRHQAEVQGLKQSLTDILSPKHRRKSHSRDSAVTTKDPASLAIESAGNENTAHHKSTFAGMSSPFSAPPRESSGVEGAHCGDGETRRGGVGGGQGRLTGTASSSASSPLASSFHAPEPTYEVYSPPAAVLAVDALSAMVTALAASSSSSAASVSAVAAPPPTAPHTAGKEKKNNNTAGVTTSLSTANQNFARHRRSKSTSLLGAKHEVGARTSNDETWLCTASKTSSVAAVVSVVPQSPLEQVHSPLPVAAVVAEARMHDDDSDDDGGTAEKENAPCSSDGRSDCCGSNVNDGDDDGGKSTATTASTLNRSQSEKRKGGHHGGADDPRSSSQPRRRTSSQRKMQGIAFQPTPRRRNSEGIPFLADPAPAPAEVDSAEVDSGVADLAAEMNEEVSNYEGGDEGYGNDGGDGDDGGGSVVSSVSAASSLSLAAETSLSAAASLSTASVALRRRGDADTWGSLMVSDLCDGDDNGAGNTMAPELKSKTVRKTIEDHRTTTSDGEVRAQAQLLPTGHPQNSGLHPLPSFPHAPPHSLPSAAALMASGGHGTGGHSIPPAHTSSSLLLGAGRRQLTAVISCATANKSDAPLSSLSAVAVAAAAVTADESRLPSLDEPYGKAKSFREQEAEAGRFVEGDADDDGDENATADQVAPRVGGSEEEDWSADGDTQASLDRRNDRQPHTQSGGYEGGGGGELGFRFGGGGHGPNQPASQPEVRATPTPSEDGSLHALLGDGVEFDREAVAADVFVDQRKVDEAVAAAASQGGGGKDFPCNGSEIVVTAVEPNTPAHKAGVQVGDLITAVNSCELRPHIGKDEFFYLLLDCTRPLKIDFRRKDRSLSMRN